MGEADGCVGHRLPVGRAVCCRVKHDARRTDVGVLHGGREDGHDLVEHAGRVLRRLRDLVEQVRQQHVARQLLLALADAVPQTLHLALHLREPQRVARDHLPRLVRPCHLCTLRRRLWRGLWCARVLARTHHGPRAASLVVVVSLHHPPHQPAEL